MITLGWILFVAPIALALYTYAAYPALLAAVARRAAAPRRTHNYIPSVSIVVPAYNEEGQIRGAIEALIAQDYPADRRQILVVSDASADRTDEIVGEYKAHGVELLRMPVRGGKTAAENASCPLLRGEIIINSDSSVRFHPEAVRRLVDAMADPSVGVASTRDVSVTRESGGSNSAEAGYVGYEMRLRRLETRAGGIVGASGSAYAIRAVLHRIPVKASLSRDFAAALTARVHGYSAVSVDGAICYVPRTSSLRAEYKRKVRTIARGADTLASHARLLDPMQSGLFGCKLLSHKVCRWLIPLLLIPAALGLLLLSEGHRWAAVLFAIAIGGGAVIGAAACWPAVWGRPPRMLVTATFAAAANVAVVHAFMRVMFGHDDHLWEPTRRAPVTADASHAPRGS